MEVEIRNDIQVIRAEESDDEVGDSENKDESKSDEEYDNILISLSSLSSEMGSDIKEEDYSVDSGEK